MTDEETDKLLELESKCSPYRLVYDNFAACLVIGVDEVGVLRRDAELIVAVRENIKNICLELKAARKIVSFSAALVKSVAPELMEEYQKVINES